MEWTCNEESLDKYLSACDEKGFDVLDWIYYD